MELFAGNRVLWVVVMVAQQSEYNEHNCTVHLKTVKRVNFTLCVF